MDDVMCISRRDKGLVGLRKTHDKTLDEMNDKKSYHIARIVKKHIRAHNIVILTARCPKNGTRSS